MSDAALPVKLGNRRSAFAVYLGTQFSVLGVTTLQALLVMPQMLRSLGKERYGIWLAFAELLVWLQYADLGLSNWLLQRCSVAARDRDGTAIGEQLQAVCAVTIAFAGGVALVMACGSGFILHRLGASAAVADELVTPSLWMILASLSLAISNPFVALGRALQRPEVMGAAHISGGITALIVTWLLAIRGYGVWAMVIGTLLRAAIVSVACLLFYRNIVPSFGFRGLRLSRERLHQVWTVTPAVAGGILGYLLGNQAQISFVSAMVAPVVAARFAFTKKLFDLARAVFDAISAAVLGYAADAFAEQSESARQKVRVLLYGCAAGFSAISTAIAALAEFLIKHWAGRDMFIGNAATAALAAGVATTGMAYVANNMLRGAGGHRAAGTLLLGEGSARATLTLLAAQAGSVAAVSSAGSLSGAVMLLGVAKSLRKTTAGDELRVRDAILIVLICCGTPAVWWFLASTTR